jgi:hypothetical protein
MVLSPGENHDLKPTLNLGEEQESDPEKTDSQLCREEEEGRTSRWVFSGRPSMGTFSPAKTEDFFTAVNRPNPHWFRSCEKQGEFELRDFSHVVPLGGHLRPPTLGWSLTRKNLFFLTTRKLVAKGLMSNIRNELQRFFFQRETGY